MGIPKNFEEKIIFKSFGNSKRNSQIKQGIGKPKYTDYGHMKAKSLILCGPNSNSNHNPKLIFAMWI